MKFWEDRGKTYNSLVESRSEGLLKIVDRIAELIDGKLVLDVGCGPGMVASLFPSDTKVIGLDFSGSMLRNAKSRIWDSVLGSAIDLPFRGEVFDAVINLFVASDYSVKDIFFTEAYRALENEGLYLYADYSTKDGSWILRKRIRRDDIFIESEEHLSEKLGQVGFEVQKTEFIRFDTAFDLGRYVMSEIELQNLKETDVELWRLIHNCIKSNKLQREFILIIGKK